MRKHLILEAQNRKPAYIKERDKGNNYHHMQVIDHPLPGLETVGPDLSAFPPPIILEDEYPMLDEGERMDLDNQENGFERDQESTGDDDEVYPPGDNPSKERTFHSHLHDFARLKINGGMSAGLYKELMAYLRNFAIWFLDPANSSDVNKIPKTWEQHLDILKDDSDYVSPVTYWVCMDANHGHITDDLAQRCPYKRCSRLFYKNKITRRDTTIRGTGQSLPEKLMPTEDDMTNNESAPLDRRDITLQAADHMIPFFYIPIRDRIRRLMANHHYCFKLLAHWRERHHWFQKDVDEPLTKLCKETWDGTGFRTYSWFFDPSCTWVLPQECPNCQHPFDGKAIQDNREPGESWVTIECPSCLQVVSVGYNETHGDPRNIALQFHADAFYPSSTSQKQNLDMMSITFLNMNKSERNKTKNIKLVGFIRKTKRDGKIFQSNSRSQEPFLKPFLDELQDLMINGLDIDYQWEEPSLRKFGIKKGPAKIRVLLFNQAGDYVGMQAICGLKTGGKLSCRHCESPS